MIVRTRAFIAALSMVACTQSYDSFDFAGGAPATGGSPPTTGGGGSSTGGSDGTGGAGGVEPSGGNGGIPSAGGNGGEGGTPPVLEVPCGSGGACDVSGGDVCCIDEGGSTDGDCGGSCNPGNEASLECNEPSDCTNGDSCCLVFNGSDYDTAECKTTCGVTDEEICGPEDLRALHGNCQQVDDHRSASRPANSPAAPAGSGSREDPERCAFGDRKIAEPPLA